MVWVRSAAPKACWRWPSYFSAASVHNTELMGVRIYSTLTGRENELVPLDVNGVVRFYVCGMTPKFHPHIGHGRTFVAMDVIRRYLEYRGYRVKYVQNFTDVDDKIIQRAEREGRDSSTTAQAYMDSYFDVVDRLGVRRADEYPTVTGYMERIIEFVAGLVETDRAYVVDGDVWFDVATFSEYGKLSKRDLNSQLVAARKELEPGKRDPRDFALWKRAKEGEPSWPSPWGRGRPGWHIECSAMIRETLGDQIDLHGGGADLIFPHHENEIAQSETLTGKAPFVMHWVHSGLLNINGEKMAHSAENFLTLSSILDNYDPLEVRHYLLRTHYRSPLAFFVESNDDKGVRVRGIDQAREELGRLRRALGPEPLERSEDLDPEPIEAFKVAMDADFNTPDALAVIFDLARDINRLRDANAPQAQIDRGRRTMVHLLDVLGIDLEQQPSTDHRSVGPYIDLAVDIRKELRNLNMWALADQIRDRLKALGVIVEDKPGGGTDWRIER
jgi:cysteinyl-tRNA synthetase